MKANHPLRAAKWIWPQGCTYMQNTYAEFRRDFRLGRVPARAPFFITADQSYMLYVNGQYVGRGPARGFQKTWAYDEYDLAAVLTRGHNWISVRVYNGGISTFGYLFEGTAGMLCAAKWGGFELFSDADWPSRVSTAYRPDTPRVTTQQNLQEQIDARLDDQEWIRSARQPRDWPQKSGARPFGVMPWHAVEPRGTANLGQEILVYERTCTATAGRNSRGYDDAKDMVNVLRRELPRCKWTAAPAGRRTKDGLVVTLPATGRGNFVALTVDLGQHGIGTAIVDATGAEGGEILDIYFSELLNADGGPFLARDDSQGKRLILKSGRTQHEFYQWTGHHYLTVVLRDARRPVTVKLALRETRYPLEIKGSFRSSDQTLNDIYRISVRTQQVCALDTYVDTPWREQAQWWGDARVQVRNTFHLANDPALLVRGVRCIARQDVPNGLMYAHAPTIAHFCILPDFTMIWALTIWDYYWQTGDLSLFVEQWPRIERLLGYFESEGRGRNGLLRYDERYWLFLDWCEIHKEGTPTLLNLWYVLMLEKLGELAALAGMKAQSQRLGQMHARQKRLVLAKLWDRRKGLFRDGLTKAEKPVATWSVHNQTLAIMCGLQKPAWEAMAAKRLRPYLRGRKAVGADPSSYWVTYVYGVMADLGYGADVVRHLRKNFAPMIPYGGTWEVFKPTPGSKWEMGAGTTSHAWSAHAIYHLPGALAGIRQTDVAWKRIVFAPAVDVAETDQAETVVPSPQGLIKAQWQRRDGVVTAKLSLPRGVTADVVLPGLHLAGVTGRQRWTVKMSAKTDNSRKAPC